MENLTMKYGIQMYSIKDIATTDMYAALKTVAEHGYASVEFAGFFGHSADQIKAWLDELGLEVTSTHTRLDALLPDTIADTVAYHKAIGCDTIIIPVADWSTAEKLDANINNMIAAKEYLAKEGMTLAFHNHSTELVPYPYGKTPINEIIERTDIELEPDVFFFSNCGLDPVEFCEKYSSRIRLVHLKDGTYPTDIVRDYSNIHSGIESVPTGQGTVPVDAVVEWARDNGKQIVVEVEARSSGAIVTGECIKYLNERGF